MKKKFLAVLLTLVSVFMLAGCTGGDIKFETQKTDKSVYSLINTYAISQNRFFNLYEGKKGFEEQSVYLETINKLKEITDNQLRLFPAIELFRGDNTQAFYDITNASNSAMNGLLSLSRETSSSKIINGTLGSTNIIYEIDSTYSNNIYNYEIKTTIDTIVSYSTVTFKPNLSYIKVKQGSSKDSINDFYIFECYLLKNEYMLTRVNLAYTDTGRQTIDMIANTVSGRLKYAQVGTSILIEDFSSINSNNFATITEEDKTTPSRKKYAYEMKDERVTASKI